MGAAFLPVCRVVPSVGAFIQAYTPRDDDDAVSATSLSCSTLARLGAYARVRPLSRFARKSRHSPRARAEAPMSRASSGEIRPDIYARAVVPEGDTLSVGRATGASMEGPMAVASSTHDGTDA
jgi:hypothetical protein